MRHSLLLLFLLPMLCLAQGAGFKTEGWQALDEALEKAVAQKTPPGVVLWLEHRGKSAQNVRGDRSLDPVREEMTLDTVFDLASLTKVIATAPAIMILAEQGKLDIEAPVHHYLPEFFGEGRELIRVRHLLTHTSGLKPGLPKEPAWSGYNQGIRLALEAIPEAPPDCQLRYSDINFILLGHLVKTLSGEPLEIFTHKHLFAPLKMSSTRFLPPADWRSRIAPTERDEKGVMLRGIVHDPTARRMGGVAGHAGLFSTAADLARFSRMILGGGQSGGTRILKSETLQQMQRVQTAATLYERRGLGWDIESAYSRPRGDLFPVGSFGHTGFTGTSVWIDPFSQSFVVFLSSRLHPQGGGSVRDLYEEVGKAAARCIPDFDFANARGALTQRRSDEVPTVLNGIDVLERDGFAPLEGLRVGLITNQTGINARRIATIDLLAQAPKVKLRALFSPEHGIRGALDQAQINDSVDQKTGRPIHSLYGERRAPTAEQLTDLDALVFDIQDIGCRFYTYISTLRLCMEAAAKHNKKFFILDRVNPIGGVAVEGPAVLDQESFTATHGIPLRHGMTVGELAQMINAERGIHADLQVIRMEGWQRQWLFDETGLPWINPSPNMRTLEAAMLYPGIGLLEFSLSVGRGTDTPFEILGAPYVDDLRLSYELNKQGLPGIRFLPIRFTPTASIFKDQPCGGVRLQVTDRQAIKPVQTGLSIATVFQQLYPSQFALDKVNTLLNHAPLLKDIRAGQSRREMTSLMQAETAAFEQRRSRFLLY
ncbi:Uncharacterized conserved protein YbbC, DUF1343 family [Prosthecobacter debontii]|uniref:Uncharacterized conserved protein YbbC, DUF1343 family n=1 Tax=Prosthecobacter debontii TaxID=48467 RepID=A0A1T4Z2R5_9BACT|nr:exo-beta-N-acetylmuramidase NamZ domain-containing protein [Prosthecobacter debontii]SKB08246.1 Uncharacterized conserved protein YbbC, DUF1343 family [Prosthecobacter debontii]